MYFKMVFCRLSLLSKVFSALQENVKLNKEEKLEVEVCFIVVHCMTANLISSKTFLYLT